MTVGVRDGGSRGGMMVAVRVGGKGELMTAGCFTMCGGGDILRCDNQNCAAPEGAEIRARPGGN